MADALELDLEEIRAGLDAAAATVPILRDDLRRIEDGIGELRSEALEDEPDERPAGPAYWRNWNRSMRERAARMRRAE